MTLTRNFKQTVVDRVANDPAFAKGLLNEAATLFLNHEPDVARLILRDLVGSAGLPKTLDEIDRPLRHLLER